MNRSKFLLITLPLVVVLALATLFFSGNALDFYVNIMEPLVLAVAGFLALRISFMYTRQLRIAFVFFSIFLFIYATAIIVFSLSKNVITTNVYSTLLLTFQVVDYTFLVLFCINLLRAVRLQGLNRTAWIIISMTAIISFFLVLYPLLENGIPDLSVRSIALILIRLIDAALVTTLVPIVWLYVSYLKSRQRQSLTFTVIVFGIICATIFDYLYESIYRLFVANTLNDSSLYAVIPDVLFLFGYLVIMVGLYAHLKDEQWGFNAVDRLMSGGLEVIEE